MPKPPQSPRNFTYEGTPPLMKYEIKPAILFVEGVEVEQPIYTQLEPEDVVEMHQRAHNHPIIWGS